jgi:hypothetical protein
MATKTPSLPGIKDGFTSRVWKVLAASTETIEVDGEQRRVAKRDGYQCNGGEQRAAGSLLERKLVTVHAVTPARQLLKATPKGIELYAAYLDSL